MSKSTRTLLAIAIILAVAAIIAVFVIKKQQSQRAEQPQARVSQSTIRKTDVEFTKDPARFPADIPIEAGAKITQNYNVTTVDGRFQATKVFVTESSLVDNLKIYTDYLTKNGWKIVATTNQPTYKMVLGTKGKASLQVSIDENQATKTKTVNISYTENLK